MPAVKEVNSSAVNSTLQEIWDRAANEDLSCTSIGAVDYLDDLDLEILEKETPDEFLSEDSEGLLYSGEVDTEDPNHLFRLYVNDISGTPLLTKEGEADLARRMEEARTRIHETVRRLPIFYDVLSKLELESTGAEIKGQEVRRQKAEAAVRTLLRRIIPFVERSLERYPLPERAGTAAEAATTKTLRRIEARFRMCLRELTDEWAIISAAQQEWDNARELFIVSNLRLVIHVAGTYDGRGLPREDLIQIGNIGLMKAVERFDYRKGFRFSTYAIWWIRQAMTRALIDQGNVVRIPVHMAEKLSRINKAIDTLSSQNKNFDYQLLSEMTGYAEEVVQFALSLKRPGSLNDKSSQDESSEAGDHIEDLTSPCPHAEVERTEFLEKLLGLLKTLKPQEETVIRMRFGIGYDRDHTLAEIGSMLNLTRERIRQIEEKALRKLRHPSRVSVLKLMG